MSLISPSNPGIPARRHFNQAVVIGLSLSGIALGAWLAKVCASIAFGYAAGYGFVAAIFYSVVLCVGGLFLLIFWRTRKFGIGLVLAGVFCCATFYGGIFLLIRLDRVAWRHEPAPVAIGPDQKATLVVYFRPGTTSTEIERFASQVSDASEHAIFRGYMRLLPSQANGHDAVALSLSEHASPEQVARYIEELERDSRVEKVYRDIAPNAIRRAAE